MREEPVYPTPHPDIAARVFDGEAIIVMPVAGEVLVLNGVGTRVWELIDGKRSDGEIVTAIIAEYEATETQVIQDVATFLSLLEMRGAITLRREVDR